MGAKHELRLQGSQQKTKGCPGGPGGTGSFCSQPVGEQMGPGPQPGHRVQLSPERSIKDTTACPSPSSTIC